MSPDYSFRSVIHANESTLPGWLRLLRSWATIHNEYLNSFPAGDFETAWGFRERPQVGFLSAAAFRCGGVSLEEWATQKSSGRGRNDLWLRLQPRTDSATYIIEAKHCWARLPVEDEGCFATIDESVAEAARCAERLKADQKRVAVSFVSLCARQPLALAEVTGAVDALAQHATSSGWDAFALLHLEPTECLAALEQALAWEFDAAAVGILCIGQLLPSSRSPESGS